jgi:hypothetical protein
MLKNFPSWFVPRFVYENKIEKAVFQGCRHAHVVYFSSCAFFSSALLRFFLFFNAAITPFNAVFPSPPTQHVTNIK